MRKKLLNDQGLVHILKRYLFLAALLLMAKVWGQTTVTIGGGAAVTCPAVPTATYTTPPSGVTFSGWTRGGGAGCVSVSNGIAGNTFTSSTPALGVTNNQYYSITISANASTTVTLSAVTWLTTISSGTASYAMMYSNNGGAVTQFGTTGTSSTTNSFTGSVSILPSTSLVLYFVPFNQSSSSSTLRLLNNSTVTVTAVSGTTYTSNATTMNWSDTTNWSPTAPAGGPAATDHVVIRSTDKVTATAAITRNSGINTTINGTLLTASSSNTITNNGVLTVASGGTLQMGSTYTNNGTTTINGNFQLDANGYGGGAGTYTWGGTPSTLIYNAGSYGPISGHPYWPTGSTNQPYNVTINSGPVDLGSTSHAIAGTVMLGGAMNNSSNLTVNGTLQMNTGGSLGSAPTYGASSTLLYNTTYGVYNEWTGTGTTAGVGIPNNVTVQNGAAVNYSSGSARGMAGNLNIISGSLTAGDILNVRGAVTNAGTLITNSTANVTGATTNSGTLTTNSTANFTGAVSNSGTFNSNGVSSLTSSFTNSVTGAILNLGNDFKLAGSWNNAGIFNPNSKAVFFNGATGTQTIANTNVASSNTETFAYLVNDKAAGTLQLSNNVIVNATTGSVLQLINAANLDLNGKTLTLSGDNGNILASGGVRNIISSVTGGVLAITGNKVVTSASSGSLVLGTTANPGYMTTALSKGLNFGTGNLTTINGVLQINANGYADVNAPKYASTSTLVYNSVNPYVANIEWIGNANTAGVGIPQNVTLNSSNVTMPVGARGLAGILTINSGSTISLQGTFGSDLSIGGNLVNSGMFNANSRAVYFNGTVAQTITGATTFDYLTLSNSLGLTFGTSSPITVNQALNLTSGKITLGANDLTIAASGSISGGSTSNYIVTNSTGTLKWLAVGNTDKMFPVGKDTTYYAPLTIRNTTGTSDISVKVNDAITNAVYISGNVVTQEWLVSSSSATTATITPAWAGAKQPNGIVNPGPGELGNYVGSYTVYPTALVATPQNQTTATGVAISSGNNYIVVGSTGAVYTAPPANDTCSGTVPVLVANDPVTHGTLNGATKTGTGTTYPDVFYKFTPSVTGTYSVTINNFSAGDRDLYIYTSCPSAVPGSVVSGYSGTTSSTTSETVTNTFTSGTTYYIAVYDYQTARGTFDIRVTANPILTVNPTSIAFGTVNLGSVTSHSFNLTADLLTVDATPANNKIVVTAPAGYKVSLNNSTWLTSVDVPYTTSSLASTSIYVIVDGASACGATAGNITFATANLVTSPTVSLTATFVVPAPTATAATDDTATTFTANWNPVNGATGYVLDVSTIPAFGTSSSASVSEGFESGLPTSGYSTGAYSLTSGTWNLTDGLRGTSGVKTGSYSLQLKASTGVATTPALNGITSVTIWATRGATATTLVVNKIVGGVTTPIWSQALTTTTTQYTIPVNDTSSNVQLQFAIGSGFCNIDDVVINYTSITPSFVTGYNGLDVSGTSHLVSNLTPNTTYYYRVRALSGSCQSLNSNVITTTTNNTVIWSSNVWSNITGPTSTLDAIVRGAYATAASGNITTKDLTVENTGSLTIGNNSSVKVEGVLTINNNVAKDNFVILTGGNLLQTSTAANNVNGIIQAQRSVTNMNNNGGSNSPIVTAIDYVYWSSPVSGQRTNTSGVETGFSPGTPANRFYEYNESKDTFKATADAYFTAGKGYAVRAETGLNPDTNANYIDGYSKTYKFNGVPNNGDITFNLTRTQAGAATSGVGLGFNMIGNPYPSNINFEELYAANSSVIYNTAYFWTNNVFTATQGGAGYAQNNYAVYNGVGGNPASEPTQAAGGSGDTTVPNGLVSVGQGFIVQAKNQGGSSLNFKNSYSLGHDLRVAGDVHFFQKQSSEAKNRFWIKLKSPNDLINTQLIGYVSGASNGFEQDYDAETLSTSSDVFYSVLGSRQLLIQGRSENFITSDVVPVGANFYQDGTYSIGLDKVEGIFGNGQKVYLKDNLLSKTIDLSQGDYSFSVSKGLNNTRFEIVYKGNDVLGVDDLYKSNFTVYRDGGTYVINSTKKLGKVEVYDASGRMMRSFISTETGMRIDMSDVSNGVYILKVENSGETKTKKIIK